MGIYAEYLDKGMAFPELVAERKKYLKRISELRGGNDILTFAADLRKDAKLVSIDYSDIMPIKDQLSNLSGSKIDVILETPGGSGVIAEDIVRMLRDQYEYVAFIVPGCAKSAGTIITMAGDDILMGAQSSLGPIDAQITWQGKVFSADAFIEGLKKIQEEVENTGKLNRAYVPILSNISPGEIQNCQNALDFAKVLVTDWLATYKFKNWKIHSSTQLPVTPDDRQERAHEIASKLCAQAKWKTHGRSIRIKDLEELRLKIIDYSKLSDLSDAIDRYYTLLRMTMEPTNIYKVIETPTSQIYRFVLPTSRPESQAKKQAAPVSGREADFAILEVKCPKCMADMTIQANFTKGADVQPGAIPFPSDNLLACNRCGARIDIREAKLQIEAQAKRSIVS